MSKKPKPESPVSDRISSGTPGLDELMNGGFVPNRMYLVEGSPGAGKTTLALTFLLAGASRGERCLYVTLSETSAELTAVAASHGWSLDGIELFQLQPFDRPGQDEPYTLYHPSEVELSETVRSVLAAVERLSPSRVVFDSLSEMKLLAGEPLRFRRQILALKEYFAGRACTVLVLDDLSARDGDLQLQSLAHGVILLEQLPFEYGKARRRLRIVKFRGVPAVEGFHDFVIRRGGLVLFPRLVAQKDPPPAEERHLTSGLPGLDAHVGGGLSWGTASLFIGPAGTGKSTIAGQYVAQAATEVPAAVFLFDERKNTFLARCRKLGRPLDEFVASGQVSVDQIEPGELSPGEFSYRVRDAVEERGVRLVLIDTLNGYMHAIPQSGSPLIRMHELLSYLALHDVATLLVVAQHGIIGSSMPAPVDISYLADCVVLLRFFETNGEVRRAISVVKKRTGGHERTIRELRMEAGGVHVGAALSEFHGVLTGVPQYTGGPTPLLKR